jgi:hypothetical protein
LILSTEVTFLCLAAVGEHPGLVLRLHQKLENFAGFELLPNSLVGNISISRLAVNTREISSSEEVTKRAAGLQRCNSHVRVEEPASRSET